MRSGVALALCALLLEACGSAAGVPGPPTTANTTSITQPSPWCVPMSRDQAVAGVMRLSSLAGDTTEGKLINGPELHTLTPKVMLYGGQYDSSSLYWAVEVRTPDGRPTIQAGMDDDKTAWAIYLVPARPRANGGGAGVYAGPGQTSAAFDALPDHADECPS